MALGVVVVLGLLVMSSVSLLTQGSRIAGISGYAGDELEELNSQYQDLHGSFDTLRHGFFDAVDALETSQKRLRGALDRYHILETPLDEEAARQNAQLIERRLPPQSNRLLASARSLARPVMQSRAAPLAVQFKDEGFFQRFAGLQGAIQQQFPQALDTVQQNMRNTKLWVQEMNGAADSALGTIAVEQSYMISAVEEWIEEDIERMQRVLAIAGLPQQFAPPPDQTALWQQTPEEQRGAGGPLLTEADIGENAEFDSAYTPSAGHQFARIAGNLELLRSLQNAVSKLPLSVPMENEFALSSSFGIRVDPFSGQNAFHAGLDFTAPYKSNIVAAAPGVVTRVGWNGPYGRTVDIDHGNGVMTRYGHLAKFLVEEGVEVAARQPIGLLGSSGRSTGAHLHYEIRVNGKAQNPWHFLKAGHYVVSQNHP